MVSANKIEILRIAEAVAQEKMIDKSIVIAALEEAIAKAAKSNYGEENEVIVEINQDNGDISISRKMLVVDDVKNSITRETIDKFIKDVDVGIGLTNLQTDLETQASTHFPN